MRTLAVGDIHGNYEALLEALGNSGYDRESDGLILLGDIVDGHDKVKQCVEFLVSLPSVIFVRGNHDDWFIEFLRTGVVKGIWYNQGGKATLKSYGIEIKDIGFDDEVRVANKVIDENIPLHHAQFFLMSVPYVEFDGDIFVHGGFSLYNHISLQKPSDLWWDRSLYNTVKAAGTDCLDKFGYRRVFVGHTAVNHGPIIIDERFINLDSGAGWKGHLSVMDIKTLEFWRSGPCTSER